MKRLIATTSIVALMSSMAMAQVQDNARYDAVTDETQLSGTGSQPADNSRYDAITPDSSLGASMSMEIDDERRETIPPAGNIEWFFETTTPAERAEGLEDYQAKQQKYQDIAR